MPAQVPGSVSSQVSQQIDDLEPQWSLDGDLGIHEEGIDDVKVNALVYGDPGAGKTTLAESVNRHPRMAPGLFFNLEGGLLSVASRRPNAINLRSVDHLEALLHLYAQGDSRLTRFRTLIGDSASELQRVSLQQHIRRRAQGRSGRTSINDIDRDDYGRMTVQLGRVLCMMRDLPVHTIITAHPTRVYPDGERGGTPTEVFPAFTPRLATQVMGFFDFVWYMYFTVDEDEEGNEIETRWALTRDRGAYKAKTRGPRFRDLLGERYENPDMPTIYDLLIRAESEAPGDRNTEATIVPPEFRPAPSRPRQVIASSVGRVPTVAEAMSLAGPSEVMDIVRESALNLGRETAYDAPATESRPETEIPYEGRPRDDVRTDPQATPEPAPAPPVTGGQGTAPRAPVAPGARPVAPRMMVRPQPRPSPTNRAMQQARETARQAPADVGPPSGYS